MMLLLRIQETEDVARGVRILKGEEASPVNRVIQFSYTRSYEYAFSTEYFGFLTHHEVHAEQLLQSKGDEAVFSQLAEAIETCSIPGLHIRFIFCNLSDKAVIRLAEAVEKNTSLRGFSCFRNSKIESAIAQVKLRAAIVASRAPIEICNNVSSIRTGIPEMRQMLSLCLALMRRKSSKEQSDALLFFTLPMDVLKLIRIALYPPPRPTNQRLALVCGNDIFGET